MSSSVTAAERLFSQRDKFTNPNVQNYQYSFSGTDARVAGYFPQRPDLIRYLDSMHTLSVSIHEAKGSARSLGYRGIKGMTRSIRTIAGSIIMVVLNDHPMRPLLEQLSTIFTDSDDFSNSFGVFGWSIDKDELGVGSHNDVLNFENRLSALLPPFNLLVEYVAEQAPIIVDATGDGSRRLFPGAGMMLQSVEIIDEGIVTSINDLVTEVTFSYIAKDYKPFSANTFHDGGKGLSVTDIANRQYELYKLCYPSPPPGQVTLLGSEFE